MWPKFAQIYWYYEIDQVSRSNLIPKYPDSVEWFLIGSHFSKQWSDQNYDQAPHGTDKEQDLSFQKFKWLVSKAARIMCFCYAHKRDSHNTPTPPPPHPHTQWQISNGLNDILKMLHMSQASTHTHTHTNIHKYATTTHRDTALQIFG